MSSQHFGNIYADKCAPKCARTFIGGGFQVHPTRTSIFDLSPSEKLQLLEDLWDDLAATPDAVPVHDWQKEELARRKANLMNNPASGLTWEEVKQRVRSRYGR
jgi:putative addiction module component (TIGR02574 family)